MNKKKFIKRRILKMKKVLSVLTVLVIVSMLFACANGGSGDSDKAPVRVSFNFETEHQR